MLVNCLPYSRVIYQFSIITFQPLHWLLSANKYSDRDMYLPQNHRVSRVSFPELRTVTSSEPDRMCINCTGCISCSSGKDDSIS